MTDSLPKTATADALRRAHLVMVADPPSGRLLVRGDRGYIEPADDGEGFVATTDRMWLFDPLLSIPGIRHTGRSGDAFQVYVPAGTLPAVAILLRLWRRDDVPRVRPASQRRPR